MSRDLNWIITTLLLEGDYWQPAPFSYQFTMYIVLLKRKKITKSKVTDQLITKSRTTTKDEESPAVYTCGGNLSFYDFSHNRYIHKVSLNIVQDLNDTVVNNFSTQTFEMKRDFDTQFYSLWTVQLPVLDGHRHVFRSRNGFYYSHDSCLCYELALMPLSITRSHKAYTTI